jgi:hypothetical protein
LDESADFLRRGPRVGGDGARHEEHDAPVAALLRVQRPATVVHLQGRVFAEEREDGGLDVLLAHHRRALL